MHQIAVRTDQLADAKTLGQTYLLALRGMKNLGKRLEDAFRPTGLSVLQFCIMTMLLDDSAPTVKDIATACQLEMSRVSDQVSLLARGRLIATSAPPEDRRIRRVALTEIGLNSVLQALVSWQALDVELANIFSEGAFCELAAQSSPASVRRYAGNSDRSHA
ncbi:DNA-binding MarR family transcriptional regulator [Paraburkholderia sp. BL6665CI2N2]|uniref:MarR family winged helix-turn-helix transcriptional regulator n=1 Tax=Paraburkholderia sp. BL6665CI2N2 TaxID=1938806 RepID=UPI00106578DF|nr:MarR family transcriptional regulator [Paraburkholderia sp. BL6665CI2N2]TDY22020.1 DNA-binding MarR family transcriptional regulator [Paraburkholderia sp. BL6665CI2N2]